MAIVSLMALASCAGSRKPPCTADSLSALRALYTRAARDVIERGECDKYEKVEQCPPYAVIEKHFELVGKAMCE